MFRNRFTILTFSVLSWTMSFSVSATEPNTDWQFTDIEGQIHKPFDDETTRVIALIFISTDCPIANSYQPLLQRLAKEHSKTGVRLFMVHPHSDVTADQARKHANEFKIIVPIIIDANQAMARRVGATVTPQAFVFARNQKAPAYQGRIDDLYAGFGKKRNVATTHDLADALDAVVTGRPVNNSTTKAVGCFISYSD